MAKYLRVCIPQCKNVYRMFTDEKDVQLRGSVVGGWWSVVASSVAVTPKVVVVDCSCHDDGLTARGGVFVQ